MYIYQVNPDGISCAVQVHRKENGEIPAGWIKVPDNVNPNRMIFINQGVLTNEKPQVLIDEETHEALIQDKIKAKERQDAIDALKADGTLPADFVDAKKQK